MSDPMSWQAVALISAILLTLVAVLWAGAWWDKNVRADRRMTRQQVMRERDLAMREDERLRCAQVQERELALRENSPPRKRDK